MSIKNAVRKMLGLPQTLPELPPRKAVRVRNTTPNKSRFNAERANYMYVSRPILDVPEELQKLGFPPRIVSGRGVTYRKEQAHA